MQVRALTALDADVLMAIGHAAHAESSYAHRPFSVEKTAAHIVNAVKYPHQYAGLLLTTHDHQIIGINALMITDDYFTDARIGVQFLLYVSPPHRSFRALRLLVKAGEAWMQQHGVPVYEIGINSQRDPRRHAKAFQKLGYVPTAITMQKEIV